MVIQTQFQQLSPQYDTFTLTDVTTGGIAGFIPTHTGDDTFYVTAYYNGIFSATGTIIFHARTSPKLSMYGYTLTTADVVGSNSFGGSTLTEEADTTHDQITTEHGYYVGDGPYEDGGSGGLYDEPIVLKSCGGATIDSIYEKGDFSEFSFKPFPQLPYTLKDGDSLVLNYEFSPKVIDEKGSNHHYLIFHSTDGHYLTWSFEYEVYPASSVTTTLTTSNAIKVFPNPASDALQVLGGRTGTIHLFDLMGRERMNVNDDGSVATLDVSRLGSGTYFLRLGDETTSVVISH